MKKIIEKDVYAWFYRNYKKALGDDYEIVGRVNDKHNIPDFWVLKDDELIPVECKLNNFGKAALKQLQRYMDVYKAKRGIAIAERCSAELPDNVTFIRHDVYENPEANKMQVVNINKKGEVIENLSTITIPKSHLAYRVLKEIFIKKVTDDRISEDTIQKTS